MRWQIRFSPFRKTSVPMDFQVQDENWYAGYDAGNPGISIVPAQSAYRRRPRTIVGKSIQSGNIELESSSYNFS